MFPASSLLLIRRLTLMCFVLFLGLSFHLLPGKPRWSKKAPDEWMSKDISSSFSLFLSRIFLWCWLLLPFPSSDKIQSLFLALGLGLIQAPEVCLAEKKEILSGVQPTSPGFGAKPSARNKLYFFMPAPSVHKIGVPWPKSQAVLSSDHS